MPTIKQLPLATSIQASDLLPVSQGGTTRGLTVGQLLSSTQVAISLASGKLLGRVSTTAGGPEPIDVGFGLSVSVGSLSATGADHLAFPVATALSTGDELIVNSGGVAKRFGFGGLRTLFSAGSGVAIDANGQISVSGAGAAPATTSALGTVRVGDGLSVSAAGTLTPDGNIVALRSALAGVALTGAYHDLSGLPTLGAAAAADFGSTPGSVADGGALATTSATVARAITIGGAPLIGPQTVGLATAAGTSQADATTLGAAVNVIATVANGAGVTLPVQARTTVVNRGAAELNVYPPPGGRIEAGAPNAAAQVPPGGSAVFVTADTISFYAI